MESIDRVMSAIAEQITRESGVRAGDVVPPKLNPPEVFLLLKSVNPGTLGPDSFDLEIEVIAFVSAAVDRAQRTLYKYVSLDTPESLFSALSADSSFGLDGVSSAYGQARNLELEEIAAYSMYGGAIPLAVTVSG